jgi:hypothetical protein
MELVAAKGTIFTPYRHFACVLRKADRIWFGVILLRIAFYVTLPHCPSDIDTENRASNSAVSG